MKSKIPGRDPNKYEQAYASIAVTIGKQDLCYKISPTAVDNGAGWSPKGVQISYTRSNCLYSAAIKAKNLSLCKDIKPLSTILLDGSAISNAGCKEKISKGVDNAGIGIGSEGYRWLLEEIGYTEETMPEIIKKSNDYSDSPILWTDYYYELVHSEEFQNRVMALPSFAD